MLIKKNAKSVLKTIKANFRNAVKKEDRHALYLYYSIISEYYDSKHAAKRYIKKVKDGYLTENDYELYLAYTDGENVKFGLPEESTKPSKEPSLSIRELDKMYFAYALRRISKQDAKEALNYLEENLETELNDNDLNRLLLYDAVYNKVLGNREDARESIKDVIIEDLKGRDKRVYNKHFGRKLAKRKPIRKVATNNRRLAKTISAPVKKVAKKPTLALNRMQYMYFDYIDKSSETDCKEGLKYVSEHFGYEKNEKNLSKLNLYAGIYAKKLDKLDEAKRYFAKVDFSLLSEKEIKLFTKYRK